jgi:altronate dehydratase small subunit
VQLKALLMNSGDNVATAVRLLKSNETVDVVIGQDTVSVTLLNDIPFGNKLAVKDIASGEEITKYGETIGLAVTGIRRGEHVHVHNVEGLRGRGDRS